MVSLLAVTAVVLPADVAGRRVDDYPAFLQRDAIGRATGRVIAHEIGHWLKGAVHTADGLMKPDIGGEALVRRRPPLPPSGWIDAATPRTDPAGCP